MSIDACYQYYVYSFACYYYYYELEIVILFYVDLGISVTMCIWWLEGTFILLKLSQIPYSIWAFHEKTCLSGVRQSEFQTSLLSYRDYLENWNFTRSKFTYETFQKANNKGTDQTAQAGLRMCYSQTPQDRVSRIAALIICALWT